MEVQKIHTLEAEFHHRRWWILGVLCLSLLLLAIDGLIVNVALPTLALELSASASELLWMSEAYVLAMAGLLLTGGTLSDRFGGQRVLLTGLAIFGLASIAAAFAQSALFLIIARAVMGIAGSLIMPATLSTIKNIFPEHERARAIGIWNATASLGLIIGPLAGGWLLSHFWWGSIFLINAPFILIALIASALLIPNIRNTHPAPLDAIGTSLSCAGICCLVFGITEAPALGWSSPITVGIVSAGVVLLVAFVVWEKRCKFPMLDLSLFRNPRFSAASISVALAYFALLGLLFVITQHLQFVLNYQPLEAGIRLIPLAIAVLLGSLAGAWLTKFLGRKLTVVAGLAITTIGLFLFSMITPDSGYDIVAMMLIVTTSGVGIAGTAAVDSIMGSVSQKQSGSAASINETALQLGETFGIAILGSILTAGYTGALQAIEGIPTDLRDEFRHSIAHAVQITTDIGGTEGERLLLLAQTAFIEGIGNAALVGAGITLVGVCVALIFLPAGSRKE